MSIRSMGVRSALRSAQLLNLAPAGSVVSGIGGVAGAAPPPDATTAGSPAAPAPTIPAAAGTPTVTGSPNTPPSPVGDFLDRVSAWIPSEAVGLFLAFGGFFSVYGDTTEEVVLGIVVGLISFAYGAASAVSAHRKRPVPGASVKRQAILTGSVALLAFAVWWFATPGSFATDPEDLNLNPFFPAIILATFALGLPFLASILKIEPLRT